MAEDVERIKRDGWYLRKENIIYVGIDLHKETHTAVVLDCWNQKLGEITIENKPAQFHKLTRMPSNGIVFFVEYPSPVHLRGKTAEELVRADGETLRDCQESRDIITRGLVLDLQHYREH